MPLTNPFRRQPERPSLRERAADLRAGFARTIRRQEAESAPVAPPPSAPDIEGFGKIEFSAYALDFPLKTAQEWVARFGEHGLAMHLADRTVRLTKPELMAFIREEGERDAEIPATIFHALDTAGETFEGWGNLLKLARARYIVAASAECLDPTANGEAEAKTPGAPPAEPADDTFTATPPDLADACLWAVQHRAWIDATMEKTDWSDERFDAETAKTNAVFARAINEPSASLHAITTKAALALDDFERFILRPGHKENDGTRIVHTVLREVAACDADVAPVATGAINFGPDAHIAELAAEFCAAYARNIKADRASMAGQITEEEWLPHYEAAKVLMDRLEATEPKTMLGMALKCLGPIGAAGYNAPADRDEVQIDAWDRLGTQFADVVFAGTLAPLTSPEPGPVNLLTAAGLTLSRLSLRDVAALHDIVVTLGNVVRAMQCQPRSWTGPNFNDVGKFADWLGDQLDAQADSAVMELQAREPADWIERAIRLEAIAEATVSNGDVTQTIAFARELLAAVEKGR